MKETVSVEVTEIEEEEILFCDACGSPESHVDGEMHEMYVDAGAEATVRKDWKQVVDDISPARRKYQLKEAWLAGRGTSLHYETSVDVCESCIYDVFSADAIEPALLGPDQDVFDGDGGDDDGHDTALPSIIVSLATAYLLSAAISAPFFLWIVLIFGLFVFCRHIGRRLHG